MVQKKRYIVQKTVMASSVFDAIRREKSGEISSVYVHNADEKKVCAEEEKSLAGFKSRRNLKTKEI